MVWAVTIGTFIAALVIFFSLFYAFTSGDSWIARRLSSLADAPTPSRVGSDQFAEKQKERVQEALASVGKLIPGQNASRAQLMMVRAGYRSPNAIQMIRGTARSCCQSSFLSVVYFSGLYLWNPMLVLAVALLAGILLPELWIIWRVEARQAAAPPGAWTPWICW